MKALITTACIFYCYAIAIAQSFEADTTINTIALLNPKSFIEKFGADTATIKYYLNYGEALPQLNLINKSGDKKLTLISHPGNKLWTFSEYKVSYSYTGEDETEGLVIQDVDFETGKGIKLWTQQSELEKRFGKPEQIKYDKGDVIYMYASTNKESKWRLKKSKKLPPYFGNYKLKNGRVVEFHFGFKILQAP